MFSSAESYTWSYPAVPESVPRGRADLTEFALRAGVVGELLDAIRLAVSEAITNVVMHAYASADGSVQVCASTVDEDLWILVSDDGGGLRSKPGRSTGLGLGLVLIAQLAGDLQIVSRGGGGTELRMRFRVDRRGRPCAPQSRGSVSAAASPA